MPPHLTQHLAVPRHVNNDCYHRILQGFKNVHIYSLGKQEDFGKLSELQNITWHLNEDVLDTHAAMVSSRTFIGAPMSFFSWSVYLLRQFDGESLDATSCKLPLRSMSPSDPRAKGQRFKGQLGFDR